MARLIKELRRRNVFKVAVAYLALAWVVIQVTALAVPALNLPKSLNAVVFYLGLIGFPFALLFAWAFELSPDGVRRTSRPESGEAASGTRGKRLNYAIIGLLVIGLLWFAVDKYVGWNIGPPAGPDSREASIAVLPFVDMSEAGENQYLGDGIAEEILNALVSVSGLNVASRTSAFSFRDGTVKTEEIGAALNVRHVLEGSVRRAGDRIRVTAQLIDVDTGFHLFSRQLDRESEDLFAIENEIAQEIVRALKPSLGIQDSDSLVERLTDIPAARELRMKARYAFFNASQTTLDESVAYLREALALDPEFWIARGELAYAHVYRAFYGRHVGELVKASKQAAITLEHDPTNGPALLALAALTGFVERDQDKAGQLYEELRKNAPSDSSILAFNYSDLYLLPRGEVERAIAVLLEEESVNPLAANLKLALVHAYFAAGDYERSAKKLEELNAMTKDIWATYTFGSKLLLRRGRADEALTLALEARSRFGLAPSFLTGIITEAYVKAGRGDEARAFLAETIDSYRRGEFHRNIDIALAYVALGDYANARIWIQRSLDLCEPQLLFYAGFLRVEEGFAESDELRDILVQMGLPAP